MRCVLEFVKNQVLGGLPRHAGSYEVSGSGRLILNRCEFSPSFLFRARGLLGRNGLGQEEGLASCTIGIGISGCFLEWMRESGFLSSSREVRTLPPVVRVEELKCEMIEQFGLSDPLCLKWFGKFDGQVVVSMNRVHQLE